MKYYKIPPEWAERLKVTHIAVDHPDGWYLCLPAFISSSLRQALYSPEEALTADLDEAVLSIGGVIYNADQAIASQRGEAAYMMNRQQEPETEEIPETASETSDDADADPDEEADGENEENEESEILDNPEGIEEGVD